MTDYDFTDDREETWWVIPHHSALDYCPVRIIGETRDGRVRVAGIRSEGWNRDYAAVKCRVDADKLTKVESWRVAFKDLYEDPCHPSTRPQRGAR